MKRDDANGLLLAAGRKPIERSKPARPPLRSPGRVLTFNQALIKGTVETGVAPLAPEQVVAPGGELTERGAELARRFASLVESTYGDQVVRREDLADTGIRAVAHLLALAPDVVDDILTDSAARRAFASV